MLFIPHLHLPAPFQQLSWETCLAANSSFLATHELCFIFITSFPLLCFLLLVFQVMIEFILSPFK